MKKILSRTLAGIIFIGALIGIMFNVTAHAASDQSEAIKQKWIMTLYNQCFSDGLQNKNISVTGKDANSGAVADSVFDAGVGEDKMYLPSAGFFSGKDGETISCQEVYKLALGYMGVAWEDVIWGTTDLKTIASMLGRSGYTLQGDGGKISLNATVTPLDASSVGQSGSVLSAIVAGTTQYYVPSSKIAPYSATLTLNGDGSKWKIGSRKDFASGFATVKNNVLTIDARQGKGGTIEEVDYTVQLSNDTYASYEALSGLIGQNIFITPNHCSHVSAKNAAYCWVVFNSASVLDGGEFVYDSSKREKGEYMLTDDERYDLYHYYFNVVVPNEKESASCSSEKDDSMQEVHLKSNGKWVKYYFKKSDLPLERTFKDIYGGSIRDVTLDDIIQWFNQFSAEEKCDEDTDPDNPIDPVNPIDGNVDINETNCWNSAGALGWILCPVIDFAHHTIVAVYDSIVQNFLEFRAEFLDIKSEGASVYTAWQTFQSIANVGFVIVLLIVIFSQLTGIGIDNLGIKRILPKLIIAAILINLSYLICMLLVDISNVLGVGLNNLFANITVAVDGKTASGNTGPAVLSSVITLAVGSAVAYLAPAAATLLGITGSVIVLPLVLGLIATLIGVLFFFILLGLRQALIIMLIVVSPIAVACYMLPNTKSVFNKWLKLFESLLLLFPICGVVMGGSAFASKVLLSMDFGFLGKLIAMLVGVVPFFFIPTLLKSSMAAAGNIGGKISGLGQSLSRGARGRVASSQWAKDYQTRSAAGFKANGKQTTFGKWRSDIASNKSRFSKVPGLKDMAARSQARGLVNYEKMRDELDFASRPDLITSEAVARRFSRQQAAEDARLVSSGDVNRTGDIKDSELTSADDFEEGTLTYDYMQAVRSGNEAAQYAIIERMLANGHHGAQSYRNILKVLEQEGNAKALETAARAGKNSRHVGDLKGGARSVFDYINGVTNGDVLEKDENGNLTGKINAGYTLDDYVGKTKFANMSEAQLFNTDNEELSRWLTYAKQKRSAIDKAMSDKQQAVGGRELTAEEKNEAYASQFSSAKEQEQYEALVSQAQKAYNNVRLRGQAKESRQQLVADIAGIPESQRASQSIDVRGGNAGNDGGGASSNTQQGSNTQGSKSGSSASGNTTGSSSNGSTIDIDHSNGGAPQVTNEQLQQMAQQYSNQAGPTGRGNVSDEDLQRNIARLQRKQNPTLQESEMLNALYNEQGVRANIREANRNGQNNNQV